MRWEIKSCGVLKRRGCAARELYGNRRVNPNKRDKEQMCPFGTGTELRRLDLPRRLLFWYSYDSVDLLLAAGARRIVISTFSDRRLFVWAKWGGVPTTVPTGPTCFRPGRTFERVTTPGSDSPFEESQLPNSFH
jgi:hypothetical protein